MWRKGEEEEEEGGEGSGKEGVGGTEWCSPSAEIYDSFYPNINAQPMEGTVRL